MSVCVFALLNVLCIGNRVKNVSIVFSFDILIPLSRFPCWVTGDKMAWLSKHNKPKHVNLFSENLT